jgi:hypothetical protein
MRAKTHSHWKARSRPRLGQDTLGHSRGQLYPMPQACPHPIGCYRHSRRQPTSHQRRENRRELDLVVHAVLLRKYCPWRYLSEWLLCVDWWQLTKIVFWVVAPCSVVEVHRRFRSAWCLHHQGNFPSSRLHGATTQKTAIFILAAVRTWNLTSFIMLNLYRLCAQKVQNYNLHLCFPRRYDSKTETLWSTDIVFCTKTGRKLRTDLFFNITVFSVRSH